MSEFNAKYTGKITKSDLRRVFWRCFTMQASWNYSRQMNMGYCFSMIPIIERLYKEKEEIAKALQRHLELFNATPALTTFILGISAAMEEENSKNKDFDTDSINAIKVALMGPISGIGDSFFWGTFKVIAAGLGIYFAREGSVLGPIIAVVFYNIPHLVCQYAGIFIGYRIGMQYLEKILHEGLMDRITYTASVVGLMVVGAMVSSMINLTTPLQFGVGETTMSLQKDLLDQILPTTLSAVATAVMYKLIMRGVKTNYILLGTIVFGVAAAALGIL